MNERRTARLDKFLVSCFLLLIFASFYISSNPFSESVSHNAEFYVSASEDDAIESGLNIFLHSTNYLNIYSQTVDSERWSSALRFANVTIPKGVTITSACVSLYISNANHDDINCDIFGNNADNSGNFVDNPNILNQTERPRTEASMTWVDDDLDIGWVEKASLENIISEITNRHGWTSGNAITLLFIARHNPIDRSFRVHSYDYDPSYAPRLEVSWRTEKDTVNMLWWASVLILIIIALLGTVIYTVYRRRKIAHSPYG
jgi:hypothetical protein